MTEAQGDETHPEEAFDFEAHRERALAEYGAVRGLYDDYARTVHRLLTSALEHDKIKTQAIEFRVKGDQSFGLKAMRPSDTELGATQIRASVERDSGSRRVPGTLPTSSKTSIAFAL